MVSNQSSCVVLWYPCALTLGDKPLPCGVEHGAIESGVGCSEFRIGFNHLVHSERWQQPTYSWQGRIQQVL